MSKFKNLSQPDVFQRLEGAAIFLAASVFYFAGGGNWLLFIPLLLLVDVSCIGYLINPRVGAFIYNLGHSVATPIALILLLSVIHIAAINFVVFIIIVWFAHIGLDRMLGYGLKFPDSFEHTHLGMIGKAKQTR